MSGEQLPESTAHILIVDDLPDHLAFAGTILRQQGYRVHAATSGWAALAFLEKRLPDLIVLDIHMEGMDGLELCRRIRENRQTSEIPVIFVTAETAPEVITAGFDAGCCDYVPKPFVRAEYLARISAHLRIARQNKALRTAYKELDRFCSAVSHDMKSPLSVMCMLLKNIISNAFKFTRGRENAKITVTAGEEDDFTVIAVRDNGAGFDMQYADRLFRIFQRLHDDSEFEGTGVGLAMAQRIMERHGGRIRMTGEVNNGATVFLYFPQE